MRKILAAGLFLAGILAVLTGAEKESASNVYPSRVPPAVQAADDASRQLQSQAAERARKYRSYAFVYADRRISCLLNPDRSCNVDQREVIYVNRAHFTLNVQSRGPLSRQLSRARVILPDGRWYDTIPSALPSLSAGTVLVLSGSIRITDSRFLPLQQVVCELQKSAPTARIEIEFSSAFRHKFYHAPDPLLRSRREENGRVIYAWEGQIPSYVPCRDEAYPRSAKMRLVLTTLTDWNELREWALKTMRPEETLDPAGRELLKKLTANIPDKAGQVRAVYNYLNRLRYLTVPVGEAKFRPQQIGAMIRNGYGDCKDKSNALYVFCRELGIPAERVLVNSGGSVDQSFPSWQFNHMIVYLPELPGYPRGLWLDAAGGQAPFGELPAGTLDTEGLVLSDQLRFRRIEPADPETVHSRIQEQMKIDSAGNVVLVVRTTGLFSAAFRSWVNRAASRLRTEAETLLDSLVPGADLKFFRFHAASSMYEFKARLPVPDILPPLTVRSELVTPFIASAVPRAVRLFNGHRVTFSRRIDAPGRHFKEVFWQVRRERCQAELKVKDDRIEYSFSLLRRGDNQLGTAEYREIRAVLNQLRARLNGIREMNP